MIGKRINKRLSMILIMAFLMGLISGCSNYKRTIKGKPLINHSPGFLIKKNDKSTFVYEYVQMKMNINLTEAENSDSFKATLRMKKDSIILLSISPALGIEVIRLKLTPDSLKFYSKVPNNKFYYQGGIEEFKETLGFDMEFGMLQDLLLGNAVMLDKQEDKVVSGVDDQSYYLISKLHRRLKKILDKDERKILPNENVLIGIDSYRYQKIKDRAEPDELLLKRFWLDPYNYKITRANFYDYYNLREVTIEYGEFEETKDQIYPSEGRFKIVDTSDKWKELEYEINKIKVLKDLDFIYNIPEGYDRKETL